MNHDLQVDSYSLTELLALFDIHSFHISRDDMAKAKKKMLMTHPDQSRLPSAYFLFYRQAYEVVLTFYQEQTRQQQSTDHVGDYVAETSAHREPVKEVLDKMSAREFQAQFNRLFDQMEMGNARPDPDQNAWFTEQEPSSPAYNQMAKSPKDMAKAMLVIKEKRRTESRLAAKPNQVRDLVHTDGTTSLYSDAEYICSDVFSKLKYDDLRKVHKDQTVFDVSETDNIPQYKSVDHYLQHRSTNAPLSEQEAQHFLEEKMRIERREMMQKEYMAMQKEKEYEQKNKAVLSQFMLLR